MVGIAHRDVAARSIRCGIARRFLRSISHSAVAAGALAISCSSVTASGLPSASSRSASSASSGALLAATMSQKAGVFGGGALGSKPDRSSCAQIGGDVPKPPFS